MGFDLVSRKALAFITISASIAIAALACSAEEPQLVATAAPTSTHQPAATTAPPASTQPSTQQPTATPSSSTIAPTPTPQPISAPEPSTFNIGDTVRLSDLEITVHGVRSSFGGDFISPSEGNYFVFVDVSFRNTSSTPTSISSLLQMELRDSEGRRYDVDFAASTDTQANTPDGDIAPGATLRGESPHQIPIGATGLVWAFSGEIFSLGEARFTIGSVAAPTPTPVPPGGTIANAVPAGQTMVGSNGVSIRVVEVISDATQIVLDENQFNEPPAQGNKFIMIQVEVANTSAQSSILVSEFDFELIGDNRSVYTPSNNGCGVTPNELSGEAFQGGKVQGNVCFEIPAGEGGLLLIHQPDFDDKSRRFLSLGM